MTEFLRAYPTISQNMRDILAGLHGRDLDKEVEATHDAGGKARQRMHQAEMDTAQRNLMRSALETMRQSLPPRVRRDRQHTQALQTIRRCFQPHLNFWLVWIHERDWKPLRRCTSRRKSGIGKRGRESEKERMGRIARYACLTVLKLNSTSHYSSASATRRIFTSSIRLDLQWRLVLVAPFQPISTYPNVYGYRKQ